MTPKEAYDARKAQRDNLRNLDAALRARTEACMMLDMVDRFVTAVESITEAIK
jgi:hypothetical protein